MPCPGGGGTRIGHTLAPGRLLVLPVPLGGVGGGGLVGLLTVFAALGGVGGDAQRCLLRQGPGQGVGPLAGISRPDGEAQPLIRLPGAA